MTSDKREILITNDDGIHADGIHVLASIMRRYGNVTVVAPLHAQSGKSAALSLDTKLYLKQVKDEAGYREYTFNGTPVDCVKIGINECWSDGRHRGHGLRHPLHRILYMHPRRASRLQSDNRIRGYYHGEVPGLPS